MRNGWKSRGECINLRYVPGTVLYNVESCTELTTPKLDWQKCLIQYLLCATDANKTQQVIYTFWSCPSLNGFWSEIFMMLSKVIGKDIVPNALIALFGTWPSPIALSPVKKDVIAFTTLLARRLILLNWKSTVPPTYSRWIKEVLYFLKLEKIRQTLSGRTASFDETWNSFLSYVNSTNCQISLD